MKKRLAIVVVVCSLILILAGCVSNQGSDTSVSDTDAVTTAANVELFPLASKCRSCHNDIKADDGTQYSFVMEWMNSTHSQSSTDPLFQAVVRQEMMMLPEASDLIQGVCASCHLPMANFTAIAEDSSQSFFDNARNPESELHDLYLDGISCMFCHQLTTIPTEGNTAFHDSELTIDLNLPAAGKTRNLYGYYPISEAAQQPMVDNIGYFTVSDPTARSAAMCATCHTLYTDAFTVEGEPTGTQLPEQVVALEWAEWSESGSKSCQSCHMPVVQTGPLSNMQLEDAARGEISTHSFVGPNSFLKQLNNSSNNSLERGIETSTEFLQNETATLTLASSFAVAPGADSALLLDVTINSMVGHKFPTGFPSRRAWLHVQVIDASGNLLYESGGYNEQGMILDNNADQVAGTFEPHYSLIDQPGQVQIYESIMLNSNSEATSVLLQGVAFAKDNRILPEGFDKTKVPVDIAVIGDALIDDNFTGGSDTTTYLISLPPGTGELTIQVELLYQSVSYRFLDDLMSYPSPESKTLAELIQQNPNLPVLVTKQEIKVTR